MIELYVVAFVAGVLTILAPCILPLLPVIVGGSSLHGNDKESASLRHPIVITLSLVVSIIAFTLLLKFTTVLLGIPTSVWAFVAGGIVLLFGINLLFPVLWEKFMLKTRFVFVSNRLLGQSQGKTGLKKDILLGAALGPVFNSCSPTYALIVAAILPTSFMTGLGYLLAYAVGLGAVLLLIGIFGRVVVNKLKWLSDPRGVFQKIIGILFIIVGISVIFGFDKHVQTFILESGWYDPVVKIEQSLR